MIFEQINVLAHFCKTWLDFELKDYQEIYNVEGT